MLHAPSIYYGHTNVELLGCDRSYDEVSWELGPHFGDYFKENILGHKIACRTYCVLNLKRENKNSDTDITCRKYDQINSIYSRNKSLYANIKNANC